MFNLNNAYIFVFFWAVMERKERLALEAFLGIILVVLLIVLVFLFTGGDFSIKKITSNSKQPVVSNSYNINSFNTNTYSSERDYIKGRSSLRTIQIKNLNYVEKESPYKQSLYEKYEKIPRYDSFAEHRLVRGILGNDIDKYYVFVRNKEYSGSYFTVRFYFRDFSGKISTEIVTHYIPARREKAFFYQSIYGKRYPYSYWDYEVIPQSTFPSTVYYFN